MKPTDLCATTDFFPNLHLDTCPLSAETPSLDSFDLVAAELQRRADAKTLLLEESLERAESAQRRFWGINE